MAPSQNSTLDAWQRGYLNETAVDDLDPLDSCWRPRLAALAGMRMLEKGGVQDMRCRDWGKCLWAQNTSANTG